MAGMTADKLEVAQSDREAAAATVPDDGSHSSYMAVNAILQGHADDWPLVQAFARHCLAERERCARHLEARAAEILAISTNHTTGIMMSSIFRAEATAIRSTSHAE